MNCETLATGSTRLIPNKLPQREREIFDPAYYETCRIGKAHQMSLRRLWMKTIIMPGQRSSSFPRHHIFNGLMATSGISPASDHLSRSLQIASPAYAGTEFSETVSVS